MGPGPRARPSLHRLVDRLAGLREEMCTGVVEVHAVFEPNAELAGDGDHRLVAEAHAWRHGCLVALHEVRPLVVLEADAMAGAMGQAGRLVSGSKAGVFDDLARRRIHRLTWRAD